MYMYFFFLLFAVLNLRVLYVESFRLFMRRPVTSTSRVYVTSHTHRDVVLKRLLGLEQAYERVLGDSQLLLQHAHRLANLVHLLLQPVKITVRTVSYEYKMNDATSM